MASVESKPPFLILHRVMKILKRFFLLAFLFVAGNAHAQSTTIDVEHYAFHLELSDDDNTIKGRTEVTVRFTQPDVRAFSLDLIGDGDGQGMTVASVTRDKKSVPFSQANNQVNIELPAPAAANTVQTYSISYQGTPEDGLIIAKNKYGERTFFGDNWPNRARHWLPTNDHPSDKATVEFIVTAPEHYQVIGNGVMLEESDLLDGTRRTHWRTDIPIPTKVTVIGAAQFAVQHAGEFKDIPIQHWVYPQDREAGFHDFGVTNDIMDFFIDNIGPYSYEKLANVQSKTRYGGMENASNIFYSERAISGDRSNESLVAHEIAHQWFGNSATEADWQHIWLSEGFATYFTQLYFEHAYGRERMVAGMQNAKKSVIGFYGRQPNAPLVNPDIKDPNQHLNANSYQKGAWVLHMLRHAVGDEAYWTGIRSYYKKYRNGNATSEDLQKEMEAASGKDLATFFKQWLYQAGQPMIKGSWSYADGKVTVKLNQTQKTGYFETPLEVAFVMADGSKEMKTIDLAGENTIYYLVADASPKQVIFDPNTWLLANFDVSAPAGAGGE